MAESKRRPSRPSPGAPPDSDARRVGGADPAAGAGATDTDRADSGHAAEAARPVEHGGPSGPEPTRYGDWERKGRCIDF